MTFNQCLSVATLAVPFLLIGGITVGLKFRKYLQRNYMYLVVYLIICLITDVLSRIAGELYNNNLIFIVVFSLLELVFFYFYFRTSFSEKVAKYYGVAIAFAVLYMVYELVSLSNVEPAAFQPYSKVIGAFLIIVMVLNCLFQTIKDDPFVQSVSKLNSVFVLYFSLNLIFFLPVNFLINVTSSVKFYFWCANFLLTLSFYTYLSHEIWKNGSIRKRLQPGL